MEHVVLINFKAPTHHKLREVVVTTVLEQDTPCLEVGATKDTTYLV